MSDAQRRTDHDQGATGGPAARSNTGVRIIRTTISPFHCLYQDALGLHAQSQLQHSEAEGSRLARAALLLYVASLESLVHQAIVELGPPDAGALLARPEQPLPLLPLCGLLASLLGAGAPAPPDLSAPPWPEVAELLAIRNAWLYPGPAPARATYYREAASSSAGFEPLQPQQVPPGLDVSAEQLVHSRTALPRDPYALRSHHLDTARGVIDRAIEVLDAETRGALTRGDRHRREPVRIVYPA